MKKYKDYYREAKGDLPRIYCDMDGVLCDFVLWANMPWTRDGKTLWNFIKKHNTHILSAFSIQDPNCVPGKMRWLRKEIGYTRNSMINIVRRRDKQDFAMKGSDTGRRPAILIDDYPKNVQQFKAAGGIGIVYSSASNTISQLKRLGF